MVRTPSQPCLCVPCPYCAATLPSPPALQPSAPFPSPLAIPTPLVGLLPTAAPGAFLGQAAADVGPSFVIYGGRIVTTSGGTEIDHVPCPSIIKGGVWAFQSLNTPAPISPTTRPSIIAQIVNVPQYNANVHAFAFEMVEVRLLFEHRFILMGTCICHLSLSFCLQSYHSYMAFNYTIHT